LPEAVNTTVENFQQKYGIVGTSLEIQEIVHVIQQVAPTDITVLITGESGVGKEIVAQAIHAASKRAAKTMVTVNCGAIPEGIIESELFGHERGSFTGASDSRKGYFEIANGGTIFLDEIGELPLATQVKFLRILENGEFMRVGSSVAKNVNVRVIAATNKDLEAEVRNKNFRPDLFYRLRSVNMRIPPLRERRDDVPVLFEKFSQDFAAANRIVFGGITEDAMEQLRNYYWWKVFW
jgi:transcriptional regulator with GAF, ATPase, and Fis domain